MPSSAALNFQTRFTRTPMSYSKGISLFARSFPRPVPCSCGFFGLFLLLFLFRFLFLRRRNGLGLRLGNGVPFRKNLAVGLRRGAECGIRELRFEALHERYAVRAGQPRLRLGKRRVAVRGKIWPRGGETF